MQVRVYNPREDVQPRSIYFAGSPTLNTGRDFNYLPARNPHLSPEDGFRRNKHTIADDEVVKSHI
jgi:hypothetical protein